MKYLPSFVSVLCICVLFAACNNSGTTSDAAADQGDKKELKKGTNKAMVQLQNGDAAPLMGYKMVGIDGKQYSLTDSKASNGLLVLFSCNTCPFVIDWEDRYAEMADFCASNNVGTIVVNSNEAKRDGDDSLEKMKAHAKEKGYNFKYVVDKNHKLADAFGATRTPEIFLFDKDMKLAYNGAIDDSQKDKTKVEKAYIKNAVRNMVAGKPINPNKTKSIGCTIKRVAQP